MTDQIEQARQALAAIPALAASADAANITRLGGLTNLVFKIEAGSDRFCLRLPGRGTEAYIDRKVEATNARAAATA